LPQVGAASERASSCFRCTCAPQGGLRIRFVNNVDSAIAKIGTVGTAHYDIKAGIDVKAGTKAALVAITPLEVVGQGTALVLGDWMNLRRVEG
jgi:hypothetical protein